MVLGFGMRLVAGGAVCGLLLAATVNAVLPKVFFGFPPMDGVPFAGSAALFVLVGMTACLVPVRRATGIDPLVVLRYE
jgi:putative ABC transport system permease protein